MVLEKLVKSQVTIRDGDKLSKHQELCCGCIYDDLNEEETYCLNCFECEFKQGEMDNPSGYQEKPEKLFKLVEIINNFFGCDAAYFNVNPFDLATHLLNNGVDIIENNTM